MNKIEILEAAKNNLQSKIDGLKIVLDDICNSTSEDSKSSAGDKHETAVSMAQLEQEKLTHQINNLLSLQQQFFGIQVDTVHTKVQLGSLLLTDKGYFYVAVGLGKVENENNSIFALGIDAPLVRLLLGKKVGESVEFNGSKTQLLMIN
jgi:transcription elongation GreA/GreB family factor